MNFLEKFNESLTSLEDSLYKDYEEVFPNIFVLGLPRSGTTLLTQVIYNNLDVSCTNNLIAKFWRTPLVGTRLAMEAFAGKAQKMSSYTSDHGQTESISDPHEFSWYWQRMMQIDDIEKYDIQLASGKIDWFRLRNELLGMSHIMEKPLVHKPLELIGYHLENFCQLFSKAIYISINRPLDQVALSLAQARLKKFNDLNIWWGSYPPSKDYEQIKTLSPEKQIAGQVYFLNRMYQRNLTWINPDSIVNIDFADLLKRPNDILTQIIEVAKKKGYTIRQLNEPQPFKSVKRDLSNDFGQKIIKELNSFYEQDSNNTSA
ncbi:sulfotransferase [Roseivirga sp. E12]|uniref:sulfotransferase n=1 Tax=Roseivirga sp. E12 TaxID=2819237 RepID=UPI001ABC2ED1|nr:sulfotransferase [Roseivirga sp. E12]MBO3699754.1 sulfotransferase [Roseivirga sp. E12]